MLNALVALLVRVPQEIVTVDSKQQKRGAQTLNAPVVQAVLVANHVRVALKGIDICELMNTVKMNRIFVYLPTTIIFS